jgi:methyl-accepting chemotaxis protein
MKKLSLTTRLVALLALPLCGAVGFGLQGGREKWSIASQYSRVRASSTALAQLGNVIHELQRERGRSAVFVGRKGAKFAAELPAQQQVTDAAVAKFQTLRAGLDRLDLGSSFDAALKKSLAALEQLPGKRTAIKTFAISAPESTAYFTQTISSLLDVVSIMSRQVHDAQIANGIACYVSFVQAKEQAGIERALLSGVFSADKFSGDGFNRVTQAIAAQDTFLHVFEGLALPSQKKAYVDAVRGPAVDTAARMRQTALDKALAGEFGIDSSAWFDAITAKIDLMKNVEDLLAADYNGDAQALEAAARRALLVYGIFTVATIVLTAAFGTWVIRSIRGPLSRVIGELTANAEQTSAASGQVAASSQSLARGSAEQAAQLEETSAALVQMSAMTKRNAESAQRAKEFSRLTHTSAETGARHMDEMRRAMDAIKASSDGISKIIKTIDEIAFQTNILALNAAVEAARAGDAGMGFAVVAEEVRRLAQRSAASAKETAEKIEEAIRRSANGVEISGQVAHALGEILEKAAKVDTFVAEIADASAQQSQGIEQVNGTLVRMDKITQGNASTAEETASAAEELSAQARGLQEAVSALATIASGRATSPAPASQDASEAAAEQEPAMAVCTPAAPRARGQQPLRFSAAEVDLEKHAPGG